MSVIVSAFDWLGRGSNWTGDSGLLHLMGQHFLVTIESLVLALAVGVPAGLTLGHLHRGGPLVTVLANLGRAIPTLGLLILLTKVATFGVSTLTAVVSLALFALPPILSNTYTGTSEVDRDTVDAARGLGMKSLQVLLRVELPLALPLIAAGIRTAAVQTFATATLASYVGTPTLGSPIEVGDALQQYDQVLGAAIVIAILALVIDLVLGRVQSVLSPGVNRGRRRKVTASLPGGAAPATLG